MSILADLVLELLGSGIGPSTDRGTCRNIHVRVCRARVCEHLAADDFSRSAQTAGLGTGRLHWLHPGWLRWGLGVSSAYASKPVGSSARAIVFGS